MSTGLYLRNGLYPREPLYRMAAPAQAVAQNLAEAGYDITPIAPWPESGEPPAGEWIGRIDQELLGFRRDLHHQFLLGGLAARAVRIEHAGRAAGYAYISAGGHVGPLAIAPDADAKAVVTAALRCALEGGARQVSMLVPGRADVVMQTALALGFRIEEPLVLMAWRPFGNWCKLSAEDPGFSVDPPQLSSLIRNEEDVSGPVKPGYRASAMGGEMPSDDAKADPDISVTDELDPADFAVITDGLRAYDLSQTGYYDFRPLAVVVRDGQTGKVVGGLHGRSEFGLIYVAWLFLPEDLRRGRIGSRVLAMAEEEGRRRGCTRIALTTLSVEAPGFYQKQGYDVAATIDCDPPGLTRYYMMKKL